MRAHDETHNQTHASYDGLMLFHEGGETVRAGLGNVLDTEGERPERCRGTRSVHKGLLHIFMDRAVCFEKNARITIFICRDKSCFRLIRCRRFHAQHGTLYSQRGEYCCRLTIASLMAASKRARSVLSCRSTRRLPAITATWGISAC